MYLLLLELPRFFVDATDNDSCQRVSLFAVSRQSLSREAVRARATTRAVR